MDGIVRGMHLNRLVERYRGPSIGARENRGQNGPGPGGLNLVLLLPDRLFELEEREHALFAGVSLGRGGRRVLRMECEKQ